MKPFEVFRTKNVDLRFPEGASEGSTLVKLVDDTYTTNMGAGVFSVNKAPNHIASLPYDEIAFCLDGILKLTVDGVLHNVEKGDFAWIPKGTNVIFDGEDATVFYGVYPADWRQRNAEGG